MTRAPSMDEHIVNAMAEELDKRARAIAGHLGRPPGTTDLTEDQELKYWNQRSNIDFSQIVGAPDPQTAFAVLQMGQHPYPQRIMELLSAGHVPEAQALVEHPFREVLYTASRDGDPKAQVEYAKRMAAKSPAYQEKQGQQMQDLQQQAEQDAPTPQPQPAAQPEPAPMGAPA